MELAEAGKAVLLISSELEEISRCSTRVAVLRDRKMIAELDGGEVSEQEIMQTIAQGHGSGDETKA
jgi:simple sugar transport system ATP-binding protein